MRTVTKWVIAQLRQISQQLLYVSVFRQKQAVKKTSKQENNKQKINIIT